MLGLAGKSRTGKGDDFNARALLSKVFKTKEKLPRSRHQHIPIKSVFQGKSPLLKLLPPNPPMILIRGEVC